jgi:triacylglycerol lipase
MATGNSSFGGDGRKKGATWTIPLQIRITIGEASAMSRPSTVGMAVSGEAYTLLKESSLQAQDYDAVGPAVLRRAGFDLDTAVFLAEASSAAYSNSDKIDNWAREVGFETSTFFDSGNVQGFWCIGQESALLVFRGTSNPGQWLRDVRFLPTPSSWGHVHIGFRDGVAAVEASLTAFDAVARSAPHVWVAGHSLGGALAVIASARLKIKTGVSALIHTYGQPAVGLNDFAERYGVELPLRLWRFVNQSDIVTRVPPGPLYRHVGTVKRIVRPGVLEAMQMEKTSNLLSGDQTIVSETVIAGGAAQEAAEAVRRSGILSPLLTDGDPMPLSQIEFDQLQLALGAGAELATESPALEGALPWFSDHAIGEYIRLLSDIREQSRAIPNITQ